MTDFNEENRFGSARWADESELRRAGLFKRCGPHIGYFNRKPIYLEGDAPLITIGGAGSGKLRDLLGYVLCTSKGQRMAVLDPRGELAAISTAAHTADGEHAYTWNPMGIARLPNHSCNPLDILDVNSPNFHADCKFIAESLIALSGSASGQYFEVRAREWTDNILKHHVERFGRVSLPDFVRIVNGIESDPQAWADFLTTMLSSRFDSVRRTAGEMLAKQEDSPKEFGSVLGELYAHTAFLNDPLLLASLDGKDFSLSKLVDPIQVAKIFFNVPAEYLSLWSPILRLMFTVTMLYKSRHPERASVMLLVDEAGQLGKFEALLRAFTFGRGAGIRAWAIFQDTGQITRNFDRSALQGFLGSAQMRQFFGVRDLETAKLVSAMVGMETLYYDDFVRRSHANMRRKSLVNSMLAGGDLFEVAHQLKHEADVSKSRNLQQRALITPEEVLAMSEDEQILFISGKDLPPIRANKYPYFSAHAKNEMAGRYLPNPYHPPIDKVQTVTWRGTKWTKVITEPVPHSLREYPQYSSGFWSYVDGHKPKI